MKRLLTFAALSLGLALAGCDSSSGADAVAAPSTPGGTSTPPPTASHTELVGKWASVGLYDVDFTLILGADQRFSSDMEMTGMLVQGSRYTGNWSVSGDSLVLVQTGESSNRNNGPWSYSSSSATVKTAYTLKNDTLRMTYKGSPVVMVHKSKTALPVFDTVAAPTFSVAGGTYTSVQNVAIASATSESSIYYTLDGSVPTTASTLYSGPIKLSANATLKAVAVHGGLVTSAATSASYMIQLPPTLSDSLVGTWNIEIAQVKATMIIGKDSSFSLASFPTSYGGDMVAMRISATWSLVGDTLKTVTKMTQTSSDGTIWTNETNLSDFNELEPVKVTATTLTLVYPDGPATFTRLK